VSTPAIRYYIRARSEDGPQFWDGSNSWSDSRKEAHEYTTFDEAATVALRLNTHCDNHGFQSCWCERRGPARVHSIAKGI